MKYLSPIVFHTLILMALKMKGNKKNLATFLYRGKSLNGVSIIDSIPHCRSENP